MTKGHDKGHKGRMSDRDAMKLALEALEGALYWNDKITDAMEALRQALEQPQTP